MEALSDDEIRGAVLELQGQGDGPEELWTIIGDVLDHRPNIQNELLDAINVTVNLCSLLHGTMIESRCVKFLDTQGHFLNINLKPISLLKSVFKKVN